MYRQIAGTVIFVVGMFLGFYLGAYEFLFKGIIDLAEFVRLIFQENVVEGKFLASGIARVILASMVGWGTFLLFTFLGGWLFASKK